MNLMIKPGYHWDPTAVASKESSSAPLGPPSITLVAEPSGTKTRQGHGRIPSVVLSPSPSLTPLSDEKLVDIPLVLDTSNMPDPIPSSDTSYHKTISQPEFWERLHVYLSYVVLNIFPCHVSHDASFQERVYERE